MNHLAHCLLSFNDEDLLLGNFIGDYVKGSDWKNYPAGVQKGILLHRAIDSFTDNHALTDRSVTRLRRFAGRFTPPVIDVLYDHVLAIYWNRYSDLSLSTFSRSTYRQLEKRAAEMPDMLRERLPRMLAADFLNGYATREGMAFVLDRFSRRLPAIFDPQATLAFFFEEFDAFSEDFNGFFPDMLAHAESYAKSE